MDNWDKKNWMLEELDNKIVFKNLERDGKVYKKKWPYKTNGMSKIKALSPSALLEPLAFIVYGEIKYHAGMDTNKRLESCVSYYIRTKDWLGAIGIIKNDPDWAKRKANQTLKKCAVMLKERQEHKNHTIYYADTKIGFIACETDLDFPDSIWEIKFSAKKSSKEKQKYLDIMFNLQLAILKKCSNKRVFLLHLSSFKEFKDEFDKWVPLLEMLVKLHKLGSKLTIEQKAKVVKEFIESDN